MSKKIQKSRNVNEPTFKDKGYVDRSMVPQHSRRRNFIQVDYLWSCRQSEVVVAVIGQKEKLTLHHPEFFSLRPDELVFGETIECYIRVILNMKAHQLFQLNHYTLGKILHEKRWQDKG